MADAAKIALSEQELHLLHNKEWILTKRSLMQKADTLLGMAIPGLHALVKAHHWLPQEVSTSNAKIHRGENYQGLPYVLLDYPAFFNKTGCMAVRSMFWWGHFFSVTLHLSGIYKTRFEAVLQQNTHLMQQGNMAICTGPSEWEHHFGADNYTYTTALALQQLQHTINGKNFVKIALKTDLGEWNQMPDIIVRQTTGLLALLIP